MHKAFVIQLFSTAVKVWGMAILEAARHAADVTGVSAYTVRKWASDYFLSLVNTAPDDIRQNEIGDLLSSDRGRSCKKGNSLLCDKEFRLKARVC